jgi:hypothetical protein
MPDVRHALLLRIAIAQPFPHEQFTRLNAALVTSLLMLTGAPGTQAALMWIVAGPGLMSGGTRKFTW